MASRVGDSYISNVGNASSDDENLADWMLEMSNDNIIAEKKRDKALPWDFVDDYPCYEAAVDNINFRDYVKVNCSRNFEQIFKCKFYGVAVNFR